MEVSTPITELEEARARHRLRRLLGVGADASPADGEVEEITSERSCNHFDDHYLASLGETCGIRQAVGRSVLAVSSAFRLLGLTLCTNTSNLSAGRMCRCFSLSDLFISGFFPQFNR